MVPYDFLFIGLKLPVRYEVISFNSMAVRRYGKAVGRSYGMVPRILIPPDR
jgi:hypothetical protein